MNLLVLLVLAILVLVHRIAYLLTHAVSNAAEVCPIGITTAARRIIF
jgi:hypothetical protein